MDLLLSLRKIVFGVRVCKLFTIQKFSLSTPFNEVFFVVFFFVLQVVNFKEIAILDSSTQVKKLNAAI